MGNSHGPRTQNHGQCSCGLARASVQARQLRVPGAGNSWAKGHYIEGAELLDSVDVVRKGAEWLRLLAECAKSTTIASKRCAPPFRHRRCRALVWCRTSCAHSLLERTDVNVMMNNGVPYDARRCSLDIERSTHTNLNRLLTQTISSWTASPRIADATDFQANMEPCPRIHISAEKAYHEQRFVTKVTLSEASLLKLQCMRPLAHGRRQDSVYIGPEHDVIKLPWRRLQCRHSLVDGGVSSVASG